MTAAQRTWPSRCGGPPNLETRSPRALADVRGPAMQGGGVDVRGRCGSADVCAFGSPLDVAAAAGSCIARLEKQEETAVLDGTNRRLFEGV